MNLEGLQSLGHWLTKYGVSNQLSQDALICEQNIRIRLAGGKNARKASGFSIDGKAEARKRVVAMILAWVSRKANQMIRCIWIR